jgi:hypothetical protein
MRAFMLWFIICGNRDADCSTQSAAENGAIATAKLIANRRAGCTTDATANSCIQG